MACRWCYCSTYASGAWRRTWSSESSPAPRCGLIFNAAHAVAHNSIYCSAATDILALRPGEGVLESAHLVQLYSASRRGRRAVVLINSRCVLLPFHWRLTMVPTPSPQGDGSDPYADELRAVPLGTDSRGARYFFFATEQQVCFVQQGFLVWLLVCMSPWLPSSRSRFAMFCCMSLSLGHTTQASRSQPVGYMSMIDISGHGGIPSCLPSRTAGCTRRSRRRSGRGRSTPGATARRCGRSPAPASRCGLHGQLAFLH